MILEDAYKNNPKPDKQARLDIVNRVSLNEKEVQVRVYRQLLDDLNYTNLPERRVSSTLALHDMIVMLTHVSIDLVPESTAKRPTESTSAFTARTCCSTIQWPPPHFFRPVEQLSRRVKREPPRRYIDITHAQLHAGSIALTPWR